ncbi:hypothetical protein K438DRAFT_722313 [Mycena galopus ATCC 62051]|nr:hypothetical protein K438DRAFT_722313 [Mycena galopus ATCC 62051]
MGLVFADTTHPSDTPKLRPIPDEKRASEPPPSTIQARAVSSVREHDGSRSYTEHHRTHCDVVIKKRRVRRACLGPRASAKYGEGQEKAGNDDRDRDMERKGGFETSERLRRGRVSAIHFK